MRAADSTLNERRCFRKAAAQLSVEHPLFPYLPRPLPGRPFRLPLRLRVLRVGAVDAASVVRPRGGGKQLPLAAYQHCRRSMQVHMPSLVGIRVGSVYPTSGLRSGVPDRGGVYVVRSCALFRANDRAASRSVGAVAPVSRVCRVPGCGQLGRVAGATCRYRLRNLRADGLPAPRAPQTSLLSLAVHLTGCNVLPLKSIAASMRLVMNWLAHGSQQERSLRRG